MLTHGSSPRARGTEQSGDRDLSKLRFIPAGAGNGSSARALAASAAVHPRGRGERGSTPDSSDSATGSSPRARGTASCGSWQPTRIPVHPRGRGERLRSSSRPLQIDGSSPRARGTGHQLTAPSPFSRFIPAGAGNGYSSGGSVNYLSVHPRGRGERIMFLLHEAPVAGSSPRARGTVIDAGRDVAERRFIPAGAGNGYFWQGKCYSTSVHPRGRGERKSTRVITAL